MIVIVLETRKEIALESLLIAKILFINLTFRLLMKSIIYLQEFSKHESNSSRLK